MARTALGIVCGVLTAALGAGILGEYEFKGTLAVVGGPLFGLVIGEVIVGAGRSRSLPVAVVGAVLGFAAIVWAGLIESHNLHPMYSGVWVAAVLAAITAYFRVAGLGALGRRHPEE
jgi:hypothetical protein